MIEFHFQTDFKLFNQPFFIQWLQDVIGSESATLGDLSFVFCSDDYLFEINKQFLNHDYFTDIITFDYCADGLLNGEVYISVDRVRENALEYETSFDRELLRVMAHGVLHLVGYADKSEADSQLMRIKELEKMNMFHVKQ